MKDYLNRLLSRVNEGDDINNPKVEELICNIANEIALGDAQYSDFETLVNDIHYSKTKEEIITAMDILLFYINNYVKQ